ncbi:MAG: AraC family transcriptional regulator [Prevotella sp.]|nr:AraC family transcriptional regulator [Prevotella sp.]
MATEDVKQMQEEIDFLKNEVERLKNQVIHLVGRNIELTERLEYDVELRRRTEVARELIEAHAERLHNADLQDDGELMALIEMRVEKERPHFNPDFSAKDLADMLGVSMNRLTRLFRNQTMHRSPDAYIENLRTLAALKLLRNKPNYTIAAIAADTGFSNIRTLQRRIQEVVGMSPVEYRLMLTKDLSV